MGDRRCCLQLLQDRLELPIFPRAVSDDARGVIRVPRLHAPLRLGAPSFLSCHRVTS